MNVFRRDKNDWYYNGLKQRAIEEMLAIMNAKNKEEEEMHLYHLHQIEKIMCHHGMLVMFYKEIKKDA